MIPKNHIEDAKNILLALKKATYNDFLGNEVFALTRAVGWFASFLEESMKASAQPVAPMQMSSTPKEIEKVTKLDLTKKKK